MSQRLWSPEDAQEVVLADVRPLGAERVGLLDALGRVLAEDVRARRDGPAWDNSAMDGFALRAADLREARPERPALLEVVEDLPAGRVGERAVGPGQASRIMTGAPLPEGADTVVPIERVEHDGRELRVPQSAEPGAHVRRRGEDVRAGEVLVPAGTELGPGEVAVLAAQQRSQPAVGRRARVAILATGDELIDVDGELGPGRIVNSNSYGLAAMVRAHGGEPVVLPSARDEPEALRGAVESALSADFVLSSGGVSVGAYDYVRKVLAEMGAEERLWGVAMKPGKPLFFGVIRGRPYFGLPGNPVSSLVVFLQFVRPALRKAAGHPEARWRLPEARALAEGPLANGGERREYLRARVARDDEGRLRASVRGAQGSHILSSMLSANGLVVLEPGARVAAGESVRVQLLGEIG